MIAAQYGAALRESGSPLVSSRKQILASLRYKFKCGGQLSLDAIDRAGFDGLQDLSGSEYDGTILVHLPGRSNIGIQFGYSYVNALDIVGNPKSIHQFSFQIPNLLNARSDSAPSC